MVGLYLYKTNVNATFWSKYAKPLTVKRKAFLRFLLTKQQKNVLEMFNEALTQNENTIR